MGEYMDVKKVLEYIIESKGAVIYLDQILTVLQDVDEHMGKGEEHVAKALLDMTINYVGMTKEHLNHLLGHAETELQTEN